jgi:hypothetical protein
LVTGPLGPQTNKLDLSALGESLAAASQKSHGYYQLDPNPAHMDYHWGCELQMLAGLVDLTKVSSLSHVPVQIKGMRMQQEKTMLNYFNNRTDLNPLLTWLTLHPSRMAKGDESQPR